MSKIMTTVASRAINSPPAGAILPKVDHVQIPFEWMAVAELIHLPSVDFPESEGLSRASNRAHKRADWHFDGLRDSLAEDGFHDPVYVYPDDHSYGRTLGNGHHRVVAAYDLGYTHVPVTRDDHHQWSSSVSPRDYT